VPTHGGEEESFDEIEKTPQAKDGFPFPADAGGKLVAEVLQPKGRLQGEARASQKKLTSPPSVEHPSLPLVPYDGVLPRAGQPAAARPLRPRHLPEANPLAASHGFPARPAMPALPMEPLVRLPSTDVNEVPPLPTLARPAADRAPLTDPTIDASTAAALSSDIPLRSRPAPFVRFNLPDPFEHHHAVRVRHATSEDTSPPITYPRPPRP
jgi:hypothetical protein